ncbi:MAG: hypothetical protein JRI68_06615 [Deltaproteobacteria bacterium]|nr:hypothetical protein [Deltaproteobacteria bacterium]
MAAARMMALVGLGLALSGCISVVLITLRPQCDPAAGALNGCMARTGCTDEPSCRAECPNEYQAFEECERSAAAEPRGMAKCVSDADCAGNTICLEGACRPRP